jgi:phage protein D
MTETALPIYAGRDLYVPAFEVKVNGTSLADEVIRDVIEVKYDDTTETDKFDTFEITINNWNDQTLDFKYTGTREGGDDPELDELFFPGKTIELWMGYFYPMGSGSAATDTGPSDRLRLMLTGVITKLAPTFPSGGKPTLKISGTNILIKMINEQETHTYRARMYDSEIALEIGSRNKLTYDSQTIPVRIEEGYQSRESPNDDVFLQANRFDILTLFELAHRNSYEVVLKQEETPEETRQVLYFGPSANEPPLPYLLEWGKSLIQFQPTLSTARQVKTLTLRSWNVRTRRPIEVTVTRADLDTQPLDDLDRLYRLEQGFTDRREIVVDTPFRSEAEARRAARERLQNLSETMITAQGSTVGTPELKAGRKIKIGGVGTLFNGDYFVETTTHTLSTSGYTTNFTARQEYPNISGERPA